MKSTARLIVAVAARAYKGLRFWWSHEGRDATLLLIGLAVASGTGEYGRELGIGEKIYLLGHVEDTLPYYKARRCWFCLGVASGGVRVGPGGAMALDSRGEY